MWIQTSLDPQKPPPRAPPNTHAPTGEVSQLGSNPHPSEETHSLKVFQARGRHCHLLGRGKCSRLFCLPPGAQILGPSLPATHLNQAAQCQAQDRKEEARALLHPAADPQPHTWTRWAGPRADPPRPISLATYFSYSVLSLSQRESLCFCQSLPCLQVVRSRTSSPLWT